MHHGSAFVSCVAPMGQCAVPATRRLTSCGQCRFPCKASVSGPGPEASAADAERKRGADFTSLPQPARSESADGPIERWGDGVKTDSYETDRTDSKPLGHAIGIGSIRGARNQPCDAGGMED
jgi:hypothetical protein